MNLDKQMELATSKSVADRLTLTLCKNLSYKVLDILSKDECIEIREIAILILVARVRQLLACNPNISYKALQILNKNENKNIMLKIKYKLLNFIKELLK